MSSTYKEIFQRFFVIKQPRKMNKLNRTILSTIALFITFTLAAQDKQPVQFSFTANRDSAGQAYLSIKAKVSNGVYLFSAIKKMPDDAFVSAIELDSNSAKFLKDDLKEIGHVKSMAGAFAGGLEVHYFSDSVEWRRMLNIGNNDSAIVKGSVVWLLKKGDEFPGGEEFFSVKIKPTIINNPTDKDTSSLWSIFLKCLGLGLLAVLTPCVFPLVPVTVSFFLKKSKSKQEGIRHALWYSFSIISIYTIPTIIITLIFGEKALYTLSTHPFSNLLFFVIFIIFAISFFGAFDITLPNSWANKADEKASKGGMLGIFFMALTLVIVSFSCTGPIIGTLLSQAAAKGELMAPILGMMGFGLGLALPFSLFAFFPSMLKSLPKSGGWLNTVKVSFGFIELALAMKFLSSVDLIYHWHLLDRDIFLVIWIVIFILMGLYLLGKLKFSHDSDLPYISVPRLFFAITTLCFALYLFPGLWGAPLKGIGGWLPPTTTQDFNLHDLQYKIDELKSNPSTGNGIENKAIPAKKYTDKLHTPLGLPGYFDLEEGMTAAKALNKPVMLDFTGHSCANCRKMEAEVWSDPVVRKKIKENFVLISLYVDESTELPESEQYTNSKGEKIMTLGDKNLDYEVTKFGFNAQPLYMFLDLNGNILSGVKYGYDRDIQKFINYLDTVKLAFEKNKPVF